MKSTLALLMAVFAAAAFADENMTVFQLDGSIHCQTMNPVSPEQATQELQKAGVEVISAGSQSVPYALPGHCGTPTGKANLLVVRRADWERLRKARSEALGFGVWVFDRPRVEVYKYDGTLQCDLGKKIPLTVMAEELRTKGIQVRASRKGTDGLARIALCGASTGNLNVYTIDSDSLPQAQELGFELLLTRAMTTEIGAGGRARRGAGPQSRAIPRAAARAAPPIPRLW